MESRSPWNKKNRPFRSCSKSKWDTTRSTQREISMSGGLWSSTDKKTTSEKWQNNKLLKRLMPRPMPRNLKKQWLKKDIEKLFRACKKQTKEKLCFKLSKQNRCKIDKIFRTSRDNKHSLVVNSSKWLMQNTKPITHRYRMRKWMIKV